MARSFNLTANLVLAGPTNLRPIVSQIQGALNNVKCDVDVKINPASISNLNNLNAAFKNFNATLVTVKTNITTVSQALTQLNSAISGVKLTQLNTQLNQVNVQQKVLANNIRAGRSELEEFGRVSGLAVRRFAGFAVTTGVIMGLMGAIKNATGAAIDFQNQMVKLSQLTGGTLSGMYKQFGEQITQLSTQLGVSSQKLGEVAHKLVQAGLSAKDMSQVMEALAKSMNAPAFHDVDQTMEGTIAMMKQFGIQGKEVEASLSSMHAMASKYAVESQDLITAIRISGGAFSSMSKGVVEGREALNQFMAIFTSIRGTTRESAESIAAGLRTIFTRLERPEAIVALKQLGVELVDLNGKFVGPYEAVNRLSEALKGMDKRDIRYAQVAESLGGYRQIGKVLPMLQQVTLRQNAFNTAQAGANQLNEANAKAMGSWEVQLGKVHERFLALIRDVSQTQGFKDLMNIFLAMANGLIRLGEALKPVLPLLASIMAYKGISSIMPLATGLMGGLRGARMASGGLVPGSGNGDTVPAVLTPGEFVVRKNAVQAIGAQNLAKLNGYADGGAVRFNVATLGGEPGHVKEKLDIEDVIANMDKSSNSGHNHIMYATATAQRAAFKRVYNNASSVPYEFNIAVPNNQTSGTHFDSVAEAGFRGLVQQLGGVVAGDAHAGTGQIPNINKLGFQSVKGNLFEGALQSLGAPFDDKPKNNSTFDFYNGLGAAAPYFRGLNSSSLVEAKKSLDSHTHASIIQKIRNYAAAEADAAMPPEDKQNALIAKTRKSFKKHAAGGYATGVNAMLTPGEFILSAGTAASLGPTALHNINHADTLGFANGGSVPGFATGGYGPGGGNPAIDVGAHYAHQAANAGGYRIPTSTMAKMTKSMEDAAEQMSQMGYTESQIIQMMKRFGNRIGTGADNIDAFAAAIKGVDPTVKTFKEKAQALAQTMATNAQHMGSITMTGIKSLPGLAARGIDAGTDMLANQILGGRAIKRGIVGGAKGLNRFVNWVGGQDEQTDAAGNITQKATGLKRIGKWAGGASMIGGAMLQSLNPDSTAAQTVGGAMEGASMGGMLGPWGAVAGGVIGGIGGYVQSGANAQNKAADIALAKSTDDVQKAFDKLGKGGSIDAFDAALKKSSEAVMNKMAAEDVVNKSSMGNAYGLLSSGNPIEDAINAKKGLPGRAMEKIMDFGQGAWSLGKGVLTGNWEMSDYERNKNTEHNTLRENEITERAETLRRGAGVGASLALQRLDKTGYKGAKTNELTAIGAASGEDEATALLKEKAKGVSATRLVEIDAKLAEIGQKTIDVKIKELEAAMAYTDTMIKGEAVLARFEAEMTLVMAGLNRMASAGAGGMARVGAEDTPGLMHFHGENIFKNAAAFSGDELSSTMLSNAGQFGPVNAQTRQTAGYVGAISNIERDMPSIFEKASSMGEESAVVALTKALESSKGWKELGATEGGKEIQAAKIAELNKQWEASKTSMTSQTFLTDDKQRKEFMGGTLEATKERGIKQAETYQENINKMTEDQLILLDKQLALHTQIVDKTSETVALQGQQALGLRKLMDPYTHISASQAYAPVRGQLSSLAVAGGLNANQATDVGAVTSRLTALTERIRGRQGEITDANAPGGSQEIVLQLQRLQEIDKEQKAALEKQLGILHTDNVNIQAIEEDMVYLQKKHEAAGDLLKQFTMSNPEERFKMMRDIMMATHALNTGTVSNSMFGQQAEQRGLGDIAGVRGADRARQDQVGFGLQQLRQSGANMNSPFAQMIQTPDKTEAGQNIIGQWLAAQKIKVDAATFTIDNADAKLTFTQGQATAIFNEQVNIQQGGGVTPHTMRAAGGSIPGQFTGGDSVHAMLTPGEFVVRREVAQKNMGFLQDLNAGAIGFAAGGEAKHDRRWYHQRAELNPRAKGMVSDKDWQAYVNIGANLPVADRDKAQEKYFRALRPAQQDALWDYDERLKYREAHPGEFVIENRRVAATVAREERQAARQKYFAQKRWRGYTVPTIKALTPPNYSLNSGMGHIVSADEVRDIEHMLTPQNLGRLQTLNGGAGPAQPHINPGVLANRARGEPMINGKHYRRDNRGKFIFEGTPGYASGGVVSGGGNYMGDAIGRMEKLFNGINIPESISHEMAPIEHTHRIVGESSLGQAIVSAVTDHIQSLINNRVSQVINPVTGESNPIAYS